MFPGGPERLFSGGYDKKKMIGYEQKREKFSHQRIFYDAPVPHQLIVRLNSYSDPKPKRMFFIFWCAISDVRHFHLGQNVACALAFVCKVACEGQKEKRNQVMYLNKHAFVVYTIVQPSRAMKNLVCSPRQNLSDYRKIIITRRSNAKEEIISVKNYELSRRASNSWTKARISLRAMYMRCGSKIRPAEGFRKTIRTTHQW